MPAPTTPTKETGQVDSSDAQPGHTLRSVRIENYRALRDLSVDSLGRINLFTGRNNSGKTSLLEALFLLSGGGKPQLLANKNVVRGIDSVEGSLDTVMETIWKPMFSSLDMEKTIAISGVHPSQGDLVLRIDRKQKEVLELPLNGGELSAIEVPNSPEQGELVAEALRIVDPRLRHIEVNSASGVPLIWGDIGLPEFVPLAVMGEGMNRIARIMLAICDAPGGIVLVDEIETGLHHSVLAGVWRAVDKAASAFNTQVIATTHSYECIQAAVEALGSVPGFHVHRLETTGSQNRCITYQPDEAGAAIRHELEMR